MSAIYDGHSASIAFAGANSSWAPEITDIDLPALVAEEIDTSHLGTTTSRTKMAGALTNVEDCALTITSDPASMPSVGDANETITITFPLLSGETTAATLAFSGFIKNYTPGTLSSNAKMEGSVTISISGDWTYTPAT
jgi:hypothetical protein